MIVRGGLTKMSRSGDFVCPLANLHLVVLDDLLGEVGLQDLLVHVGNGSALHLHLPDPPLVRLLAAQPQDARHHRLPARPPTLLVLAA